MNSELNKLYILNKNIDIDRASDGAFEAAGVLPGKEDDIREYRKLAELHKYRNRLIAKGKFEMVL